MSFCESRRAVMISVDVDQSKRCDTRIFKRVVRMVALSSSSVPIY
jgi:hypothetical protein